MPWNLEKAIADTREWYRVMLNEKDFAKLDLSYITQDLLNFYELYAKPKDQIFTTFVAALNLLPPGRKTVKDGDCSDASTVGQLKESWTYYGHHCVFNGMTAEVNFINDNESTGPDSESNACWGYHPWKAKFSMGSPPINCPRGSQGSGSAVHGIR